MSTLQEVPVVDQRERSETRTLVIASCLTECEPAAPLRWIEERNPSVGDLIILGDQVGKGYIVTINSVLCIPERSAEPQSPEVVNPRRRIIV